MTQKMSPKFDMESFGNHISSVIEDMNVIAPDPGVDSGVEGHNKNIEWGDDPHFKELFSVIQEIEETYFMEHTQLDKIINEVTKVGDNASKLMKHERLAIKKFRDTQKELGMIIKNMELQYSEAERENSKLREEEEKVEKETRKLQKQWGEELEQQKSREELCEELRIKYEKLKIDAIERDENVKQDSLDDKKHTFLSNLTGVNFRNQGKLVRGFIRNMKRNEKYEVFEFDTETMKLSEIQTKLWELVAEVQEL